MFWLIKEPRESVRQSEQNLGAIPIIRITRNSGFIFNQQKLASLRPPATLYQAQ
jgi:hypothetical protein